MGSSPVPGITDVKRTKATSGENLPSFQALPSPSTSGHSITSSRTGANDNEAKRPSSATVCATGAPAVALAVLPADLQSIVDAWNDVDPALRPGIVAMVLTAAKRGVESEIVVKAQ